ncbi:MAG: hypothetical protein QG656_1958 [Candidatus Hydrogenedentes bacterium]|nr:hypothetical protein [Candidatus Hydrogenedentota bacterium]
MRPNPYLQGAMFALTGAMFALSVIAQEDATVAVGGERTVEERVHIVSSVTDEINWGPEKQEDEILGTGLPILESDLSLPPAMAWMWQGWGPDSIAHIRGHLAACLGADVSADKIRAKLKASRLPELTELLTMALAWAGDPDALGEMVQMVENHPEGGMREWALFALRKCQPSPEMEKVYRKALEDSYATVSAWGMGCVRSADEPPEPPWHKYYPLRQEAAERLRFEYDGIERPESVWKTPLDVDNMIDALAGLFEDREPSVCADVVEVLGQLADGSAWWRREDDPITLDERKQALNVLTKFVRHYDEDPALTEAIEKAKLIIATANDGRITTLKDAIDQGGKFLERLRAWGATDK